MPGDRLCRQLSFEHGHADTHRHQHRAPPDPVGENPLAIAITPDGKTAYVTNHLSDTVTPIRTAVNKAGAAIPVENGAQAIAITP